MKKKADCVKNRDITCKDVGWLCFLIVLYYIVQYIFLATEQAGTYLKYPFCDIISHMFFLARPVARKILAWIYPWSLKYAPVAYTGFWLVMPRSLLKYMGILLFPCSVYRAFFGHGGILLYNVRIVHCIAWWCIVLHRCALFVYLFVAFSYKHWSRSTDFERILWYCGKANWEFNKIGV